MPTHAFGAFYEVDENYDTFLREGCFVARIEKVEAKTTKTDKPMVVVTLGIEGAGTINYYLIDNASSEEGRLWTNKRFTRFFDCFGINRGNFRSRDWIGKTGHIRIGKTKLREDGKQFFEVARLFTKRDLNEWKPTNFEDEVEETDMRNSPFSGEQKGRAGEGKSEREKEMESRFDELPSYEEIPF